MTQEMCDKVGNTHSSAIQFVAECYKIQKMCKSFLALFYISDWYKTQEMCVKIIFDYPFSIRYVSDQYKTQYVS